MTPPSILVTGFGPFPGVDANPTEALVRRLETASGRWAEKARLSFSVLPTEWAVAPGRVAGLLTEHDADAGLHFGVSARATTFTLETIAERECNAVRPDASGVPAGEHIQFDGDDRMKSSLPLGHFEEALCTNGFTAERSSDCGGYLCNAVFYKAAQWSAEQRSRRPNASLPIAGFVHVPSNDVMDTETLYSGAAILLDTLVDFLDRGIERKPAG